jgi:hypothetical protein
LDFGAALLCVKYTSTLPVRQNRGSARGLLDGVSFAYRSHLRLWIRSTYFAIKLSPASQTSTTLAPSLQASITAAIASALCVQAPIWCKVACGIAVQARTNTAHEHTLTVANLSCGLVLGDDVRLHAEMAGKGKHRLVAAEQRHFAPHNTLLQKHARTLDRSVTGSFISTSSDILAGCVAAGNAPSS